MTGSVGATAPDQAPTPQTASASAGTRVAYVMSRFPTLRETFVLHEILAVEELGVPVELYPLIRQREAVVHPAAEPLVARAHYLPYISVSIMRSQLHFLRRRPRAYLTALAAVMRSTLGSRNYFFGGLAIFPKVAHAARMMEADGVTHVHCHFANHPTTAGFIVHRLTGIRYSFTAHAFDIQRDQHMLCRKISEAAFVITISDFNHETITRICPGAGEVTEVVHCGVDTRVLRPRATGLEHRTDPVLSILCVGGLVEVKGQRHLIEACRMLTADGIDFTCRLVGDGPDRAKLASQITAAGLGDRILMLGPQTHGRVLELMDEADVLVSQSVVNRRGEHEGLPVVIMEAMALGLPVIATDQAGIPELVRHGLTGTLVPSGRPDALAAALRQLSADPETVVAMTRRARAEIEADYDLRSNAARLVRGFMHGRLG